MPKYLVVSNLTISVNTQVEANSAEEAREIAFNRGIMGLCYHCASAENHNQWTTSGELDGLPSEKIEDIEVLELDE